MSSGQVAQRPYGSFRAKYGIINSSPILEPKKVMYTKPRTTTKSLRPIAGTTTTTTTTTNKTDELRKSSLTPRTNRKIITDTALSQGNNGSSYTSKMNNSSFSKSAWSNGSFYSSSSSNKIANLQKSLNLIDNNSNSSKQTMSTCLVHSKSPISSGTSVESIVPKYGPTNGYLSKNVYSGSQKRAYNAHVRHVSKENVPTTNATKKSTIHASSSSSASSKSNSINNKKQIKESPQTFSSKFPQGLPFENEFYRRDYRSTSITSSRKVSSYNNSINEAHPLLPFEDEFQRKPSNEALYVDFSKCIPKEKDRNNNKNIKNGVNNNINKNSYYLCHDNNNSDKDKVTCNGNNNNDRRDHVNIIDRDQPVVYVAVASWIPKCNQHPSYVNIKESTTKGCKYVNFLSKILLYFLSIFLKFCDSLSNFDSGCLIA